MKKNQILTILAVLAVSFVPFAEAASGFGGARATPRSAPVARSVSPTPASRTSAPIRVEAPKVKAPPPNTFGTTRSSPAIPSQPVKNVGATNDAYAQGIAKQKANDAFNNRKKVIVGAAAGAVIGSTASRPATDAPKQQTASTTTSGNNYKTSQQPREIVREKTVYVNQRDSSSDLLTGVLIGQAINGNHHQPVYVNNGGGQVAPMQAGSGNTNPESYSKEDDNSISLWGFIKVIFWIAVVSLAPVGIYWWWKRRQAIVNHEPNYKLGGK